MMAYFTSIHRATGGTYYFRIIRQKDGLIWDNIALEYSIGPSWADSAITMVELELDLGQYPINLPTEIDAKAHDIIIYTQAGGSPVVGDSIELGLDIKVGKAGNAIFGF